MFLNPGPGHPPPLPNQTHLIELMSSLEETPGPEMGVSDKGDIKMCSVGGRPGPGLRNTGLSLVCETGPMCLVLMANPIIIGNITFYKYRLRHRLGLYPTLVATLMLMP